MYARRRDRSGPDLNMELIAPEAAARMRANANSNDSSSEEDELSPTLLRRLDEVEKFDPEAKRQAYEELSHSYDQERTFRRRNAVVAASHDYPRQDKWPGMFSKSSVNQTAKEEKQVVNTGRDLSSGTGADDLCFLDEDFITTLRK